jgi:hypothetical protein
MSKAGCEPIRLLPHPTDRSSALGQVTATALALGESNHEPLWLTRKSLGQMRRILLPKIANHRLVHRQASTKLTTESAENYSSPCSS